MFSGYQFIICMHTQQKFIFIAYLFARSLMHPSIAYHMESLLRLKNIEQHLKNCHDLNYVSIITNMSVFEKIYLKYKSNSVKGRHVNAQLDCTKSFFYAHILNTSSI
jgi:hypothetical protein